MKSIPIEYSILRVVINESGQQIRGGWHTRNVLVDCAANEVVMKIRENVLNTNFPFIDVPFPSLRTKKIST